MSGFKSVEVWKLEQDVRDLKETVKELERKVELLVVHQKLLQEMIDNG
jgi:vacuolar-type H+-ATPase subunit F/Vma7